MNKKLEGATDDELSAAVAEHVAGYKKDRNGYWRDALGHCVHGEFGDVEFATSADAVLPLLNKLGFWSARFDGDEFVVTDDHMDNNSDNSADAPTFPRAACIALLRAKGIKEIAT